MHAHQPTHAVWGYHHRHRSQRCCHRSLKTPVLQLASSWMALGPLLHLLCAALGVALGAEW